VGEPHLFGGTHGAAGLVWFLGQQLAGVGGSKQASFNFGPIEDTAGDQAIEADPGLEEGVVAPTSGGVRDGGQFLLKDSLAVGMASRSRARRCPP
jgi:hypothetical protein